ncbi:MAG: hypothetical protein C4318_06685 [Acidimicrobiia bacterium]
MILLLAYLAPRFLVALELLHLGQEPQEGIGPASMQRAALSPIPAEVGAVRLFLYFSGRIGAFLEELLLGEVEEAR